MQYSCGRLWLIMFLLGLAIGRGAIAQTIPGTLNPVTSVPGTTSRFFTTSDGVRLHYLEANPRAAHTIVFVPGWTMPGWIFQRQIAAFAPAFHVVAFDPRGQGDSEIAMDGYDPKRRGLDIGELLTHVGPAPALVVGWSLGVLDVLADVHVQGDARLAGLVLVDNSVGEEPAPQPGKPRHARPLPHAVFMHNFIRGMFHQPQIPAFLDQLTQAALRTPEPAARALLSYPVPRSYWREAVYAAHVPVLYVVRPGLSGQAANLQRNRPNTETEVFSDAGHALFVDDAARFNVLMAAFIHRYIWP
jgi:non-heme chloroperoxidase